MAITVNSTVESGGQPSATHRSGTINVDLDASSPAGGYDLSAALPDGIAVTASAYVPHYDGSALRWFRIVQVNGTPRLKIYANTNAAPGAEDAGGTDLAGHTGLEITWSGH